MGHPQLQFIFPFTPFVTRRRRLRLLRMNSNGSKDKCVEEKSQNLPMYAGANVGHPQLSLDAT